MIRPLADNDFDQWLPLWQGYLGFYRASLTQDTTSKTFERLARREDGLSALVAQGDDSYALIGLAHMVFHPSTWSRRPYCYLEDLFVSPRARGTAVARDLITAVYAEADRQGAARTYWHTQQYNAPARSLYDQLGNATSFVVYQR
ncbi:MAG: GNAT family N-acetyltransferase [Acidimicrobiales bacterium]|nr:GNAT family N-acetyltransferase [Acidimicrobiales bacterium]